MYIYFLALSTQRPGSSNTSTARACLRPDLDFYIAFPTAKHEDLMEK